MGSVVLDLQKDALNHEARISTFIKKAHVLARKLELPELAAWLECEINGYGETGEVPWYRVMQGRVRTWHPELGLQPVKFEDPKLADFLSRRNLSMSISGVENLIEGRTENSVIGIPFPKPIEQQLMKALKASSPPALIISYASLSGILEAVRTICLNWALRLESLGVVGEGVSFTQDERAAAQAESFDIEDLHGRSPGSSEPEPQPDDSHPGVRKFLSELSKRARDLGLEAASVKELQAELDTIGSQLKSPRPKPVIINESLTSLRRILISAGGQRAAELVVRLSELSLELNHPH